MTEYPYKIACRKCGVEYFAKTPHARVCRSCKSYFSGKSLYPKLFYKNRKLVFVRDEDKCQCCGCSKDSLHTNSLIVHHIDCDRGNNSMSNLITLCVQCHMSLHAKFDKPTLRRSNIYKLFAQDLKFGEFGKNLIYEPAKQLVKKQFTGKPKLFFKTKK